MTSPSLTRLLALQVALSVVSSAGGATLAVALRLPDWVVALTGTLVGLLVFAVTAGRTLRQVREILQALTDGVRGFGENDFSLRLAVPRSDELGELVALYNEMGDALRRSRSDLLQRELLLDTLLQSAPMAILLVDERHRIAFANQASRRLLRPEGRLEGRLVPDVLGSVAPELREAVLAWRDALVTTTVTTSAPDETYRVAFREFQLNTRRLTLLVLERMTNELRRQEVEVWKKVIRVMSHEMNNSLAPVGSLVHSARQLVERGSPPDRIDGILGTVEERVKHLSSFLEGYARFARLPKPRVEETDLGAFLEDLRRLVPFRLELVEPPVAARLDRAQMQQVVLNLVKNAVEAGSPEDEILVRASRLPSEAVCVEVLDRGRGMDDETFRKALLPFYSSKQTGSGLGLPLCREIVEAHGGTLSLQRRAGGGMAVVSTLP